MGKGIGHRLGDLGRKRGASPWAPTHPAWARLRRLPALPEVSPGRPIRAPQKAQTRRPGLVPMRCGHSQPNQSWCGFICEICAICGSRHCAVIPVHPSYSRQKPFFFSPGRVCGPRSGPGRGGWGGGRRTRNPKNNSLPGYPKAEVWPRGRLDRTFSSGNMIR